jgi:Coenzyme PQQ synthesis protein D (PqqD)
VKRPGLDGVFARSEQRIGRKVGDAYVIVPVEGQGADLDTVLNLNRVAAFVWEQLDGEKTGVSVVDAVVSRFDVDRERAAADYLELLGTLLDAGAIVPTRGGAP